MPLLHIHASTTQTRKERMRPVEKIVADTPN